MSSYTSVKSAEIIPHNSNRLLSVSFSKDKVQNIVHSNEVYMQTRHSKEPWGGLILSHVLLHSVVCLSPQESLVYLEWRGTQSPAPLWLWFGVGEAAAYINVAGVISTTFGGINCKAAWAEWSQMHPTHYDCMCLEECQGSTCVHSCWFYTHSLRRWGTDNVINQTGQSIMELKNKARKEKQTCWRNREKWEAEEAWQSVQTDL